MVKVVGIKFKTSGRIYYFDPLDLDFHVGDGAIVETSRGIEFGDVACDIKEVSESEIVPPLKPVLRIATEEDKAMRAQYAAKEPEAFALCEQRILDHGLDMKLVDAEYIFNGSKIVFYFTADERVDFRDLVKDLAYALRTRIELRQIGVRDETKMLGGLGPCGRPVCCSTFLDDFRPVSIKMAKEQNLSLSPTKISGLCGRLMCCLQYEQNVYESMKKVMPKVGKEINTIDGTGVVVENNAITEKTKVRLTAEDGTVDIREYPYTHLGPVGEPLPKAALECAQRAAEENPLPVQRKPDNMRREDSRRQEKAVNTKDDRRNEKTENKNQTEPKKEKQNTAREKKPDGQNQKSPGQPGSKKSVQKPEEPKLQKKDKNRPAEKQKPSDGTQQKNSQKPGQKGPVQKNEQNASGGEVKDAAPKKKNRRRNRKRRPAQNNPKEQENN